jgi:hypothetical protein
LGRTVGLLSVVDSAGTVIDRGRKQRLFTGSARVAAMMLIRTCEHPGCRMPARFNQVDHDTEWAAGLGETIQLNSRIKCASHNVFTSKHLWQTKRGQMGTSTQSEPMARSCCPSALDHPTWVSNTSNTLSSMCCRAFLHRCRRSTTSGPGSPTTSRLPPASNSPSPPATDFALTSMVSRIGHAPRTPVEGSGERQ